MALAADKECTYEVEYTSTGEGGLHECRRVCRKNPDHKNFVPINTFTQDDLPSGCQSDEMVNIIKIIADLTVRICVFYTSMSRPTTFPETDKKYTGAELRGCSNMRVGTGFISNVTIRKPQTGQDGIDHCPCYNCRSSKDLHTVWGQVSIITAAHVVCTPDEIVHSEVDCFYDSDEDSDVRKLYGDSMRASNNLITKVDFGDDFCQFVVLTHDIDLCEKLCKYKMYDLLTMDLGISPSMNSCLTIVVSHPHGCTKCVSWGEWTSCDIKMDPDGLEKHRYVYNTSTCPGSSGALVWLLETSQQKWQKIYVHSGGLNNGLNISGAVEIFREFISSVVPCQMS